MVDELASREWRQVRIYAELGHAHAGWSNVTNGYPYALLDELLPTLSYINAASVLDDALQRLIGSMPGKCKPSLGGRLRFLRDEGRLFDFQKIDGVRKRRNEIAHDGAYSSWHEFYAACGTMEAELMYLGVLGVAREYKWKVEKSPMRDSKKSGYIAEATISVRVFEDEQVAGTYRRTYRIAKSQ